MVGWLELNLAACSPSAAGPVERTFAHLTHQPEAAVKALRLFFLSNLAQGPPLLASHRFAMGSVRKLGNGLLNLALICIS